MPHSAIWRFGILSSKRGLMHNLFAQKAAGVGGGHKKHKTCNKKPGCLGYIGDEILPSYMWIIINHYHDPYLTTRIQWKVRVYFFVAHLTKTNPSF